MNIDEMRLLLCIIGYVFVFDKKPTVARQLI